MDFAPHLLPEMRLGEGAVLACLVVLALILGSRSYGGVRHLRVGERLLIVGTSPMARLVVEEIARRPDRYAPLARQHRRAHPELSDAARAHAPS